MTAKDRKDLAAMLARWTAWVKAWKEQGAFGKVGATQTCINELSAFLKAKR